MTETNPEQNPDVNPALDDMPSGEEIHEQYIGEEVAPDDDPNIQEHYRG